MAFNLDSKVDVQCWKNFLSQILVKINLPREGVQVLTVSRYIVEIELLSPYLSRSSLIPCLEAGNAQALSYTILVTIH